jgi:hypothetical protein
MKRRLLLLAGAAVVLAYALADPGFRDAEGFLSASFCLPAAVAASLLLIAAADGSAWASSARWAAVAIAGQAAALQWIDAGNAVRYQHYRPLSAFLDRPLPVLVMTFQLVAVSAGFTRLWRPVASWMRENLPPTRLAAIALLFVGTAAALSREPLRLIEDYIVAVVVQLASLANLLLAAAALPGDSASGLWSRISNWLGRVGGSSRRIDRSALVAALAVALTTAFLSYAVWDRHPHLADEVCYYLQARLMARGAVDAPTLPAPEAFPYILTDTRDGRWFPVTPPGWAAILAAGVTAGIPWLVNPMLAGVNVLLVYWLLGALYDRRLARIGMVMFAASPWHLFLSMTFMNHTSQLTAALLAAIGVVEGRRRESWRWALLGGLGLGLTSLIRPLDGAVLGLLLALWSMGLGAKRLNFRALAAFALGTAIAALPQLAFNRKVTGSPARFPINVLAERIYGPNANALGFGKDRGMGWALDPFPGHGPADAAVNALLNGHSLNTELLGWPTGSMLLLAMGVFGVGWRRLDRAMVSVFLGVCGVYSLYWFSGGPDFGARYWFLVIVPGIVLCAQGLRWLSDRLGSGGWRAEAAALALCAVAVINFLPWRSLDKYRHYLNMRADVREMARTRDWRAALVFIRGASFPDYSAAVPHNPLDLAEGGVIFAWDKDEPTLHRVLKAFPDREVWILRGPSLTKKGYEVERGPVSPAELLATP